MTDAYVGHLTVILAQLSEIMIINNVISFKYRLQSHLWDTLLIMMNSGDSFSNQKRTERPE